MQPVAQGGMEAKIGAKNTEMKKQRPVTIEVMPVLPPSAIPAPDSTNAVTGEVPISEPMDILSASTIYATADPSKSWVRSSMKPAYRAMEYRVPVVSRMSTYKKVIKARPNCPPAPARSHCWAVRVFSILWKVTTFLKKSKESSPSAVWGKKVTGVGRGHEMIATRRMPAMIAPLTRYINKKQVRMPPQKMPIHRVGLRILVADVQAPSTMSSFRQPARVSAVDLSPVIAPIPALYVNPMRATTRRKLPC